jgi:hypothetical protein
MFTVFEVTFGFASYRLLETRRYEAQAYLHITPSTHELEVEGENN